MVFFQISTDFTLTSGIPLTSLVLNSSSIECSSLVKPRDFTSDLKERLHDLYTSKSEQRLQPPYYRGCWHGVSRCFLCRYRQISRVLTYLHSSLLTELYNPKAFIVHAASHCHPFGHCKRFSTAASRRSLGSVSVPVWLTILSDQLPVIALVSLNLTNKLIGRGFI